MCYIYVNANLSVFENKNVAKSAKFTQKPQTITQDYTKTLQNQEQQQKTPSISAKQQPETPISYC
jgi:hypothetical protein